MLLLMCTLKLDIAKLCLLVSSHKIYLCWWTQREMHTTIHAVWRSVNWHKISGHFREIFWKPWKDLFPNILLLGINTKGLVRNTWRYTYKDGHHRTSSLLCHCLLLGTFSLSQSFSQIFLTVNFEPYYRR